MENVMTFHFFIKTVLYFKVNKAVTIICTTISLFLKYQQPLEKRQNLYPDFSDLYPNFPTVKVCIKYLKF
jgi:hypothetical protein